MAAMKANTSRTHATAFDAFTEVYDAGRRRLPPDLLAPAFAAAGLGGGSRVMEVGAGTGQLTATLLDAGMRPVAIEPGDRMRELLSRRYPGLPIRSGFFEDQPVEAGAYDGIVGANSWHWVDPARGYPLAASLLRPGGALLFYWTFSLLEPGVQRRLNAEVFTGPYANQARDPDEMPGYVEEITAAGRQEMAASGDFAVSWWQSTDDTFELRLAGYLDYLRSFADIASLDEPARAHLAERVTEIVGPTGSLSMTDRVYMVVAHRIA
jgi:SAM-dependent methyltransferase